MTSIEIAYSIKHLSHVLGGLFHLIAIAYILTYEVDRKKAM